MHAIRQKCRPKHQVLILKCYPRMTKGAVDVKPNSSELSYLLYYATTRRSKVQKVGAFLEKKTASDVWRARIGDVQVTLQILAGLIEKAPRDLPLYAPYVLKILNLILRSRDITMVESSLPTFDAFCEHHDGASLSADQEYLYQYEQIVGIYASFASTRPPPSKAPISAPVAVRWRNVGLQAIKSVASADALASVAGRQLNVIVPVLLENMWTGDQAFLDVLYHRLIAEEKTEQEKLTRRRSSYSTVRTVDTVDGANAAALSGTAADADKVAEQDLGLLAMQCLKQLFAANNRYQIYGGSTATLTFIADRVAQNEPVLETGAGAQYRGWATRIFEMETRWTPVQDRYVILVTAMDALVRSPLLENNLQQQLVLTTMVDSLLQSDINLIGLSVMDVLFGLVQHVLRILQLGGSAHLQQESVPESGRGSIATSPSQSAAGFTEIVTTPSNLRRDLLARLQSCIGNLATHVYYADQISDMVSAILLRLKPSPLSSVPTTTAAIENPDAATSALSEKVDMAEDSNTDGFFSFDTAKISALESIKKILLVSGSRRKMAGGALQRNRVRVKVWEGTQWLLRDSDGRVRKAYVDALITWLNQEMTKSDLEALDESPKSLTRTNRDDSAIGLSKRAVSNASQREKSSKPDRTTFLQLLHLAIYENAIQFVDSEADIVLLHLLLTSLVERLGVNAVKHGLPMIFRLQEDIQEVERPLAKVRIGSLCHGYFWMLTEHFEFESSTVGRDIQNEISRRQGKGFWVENIRFPPLPLQNIGMPGSVTGNDLPMEKVETESLLPFDDRFQLVKLVSLAYEESLISPPSSPSASPGRSFSQPILGATSEQTQSQGSSLPEKIKDQMMLEWTKESVIAHVHEGTKTVSLNGSRSGTLAHRNFLAVNGTLNGSNSGTHSPAGHHHNRSRPNSTYGLVGGLNSVQKMRKGSGQSPSPASESSRASVTRVDQLKRVLSGQQSGLPNTRAEAAQSDASSDSMVSMDFTVSELSFNPGQENIARSTSQRGSNDRARSKSRDRVSSIGDPSPLSSNPVMAAERPDELQEDVPPVPPLPASLAGENTTVQDYAVTGQNHTSRSVKREAKSRGARSEKTVWDEDTGVATDLEDLLRGIEAVGFSENGNVAKPPY